VIESTAMATGAVAGGALLALVGIGPALALDLLTFLLAAVLFAAMPTAGQTDAPAVDGADDGAPAPRLHHLLADRTIATAVGASIFAVAGLVALFGASRGRSARRSLRLRQPEPIRSSS
jgi:hypothetical protein